MALRHRIQQWGHEYIPVIFMTAATGSTFTFLLGKLWLGLPSPWLLIPIAAAFALCIELTTLTFGQDMQDCITHRAWGQFWALALWKALLTYAAGTFFLANASAMFWAPRDALLGIDPHVWAWVMAVFVFGVQFLVKLAPEHKPAHAGQAHTKGKAPLTLPTLAAGAAQTGGAASNGSQPFRSQ